MMILQDNYTLANGITIPKLGLGTWFIENDAAADAKTYEAAAASIDESLAKMGFDYLDLMIIHSPQPWDGFRADNRFFAENKEVWRALEEAYTAGKVKAIGVSNFLVDDLENILSGCRVKPMVNQILFHIGNTPLELVEFCKNNDILVEAYSPVAHGEALKNEKIQKMAASYGVSAARLCIRYVIELGTVALPKTASSEHMKENADIDFTITAEDMETLKHEMPFNDYGEFSFFPVFSGK